MMVVYGMRLFWCCVFYSYISSTNAVGSPEKHARPAARRFLFLWYLELWVAQMCPRNDSGNRVSWIRNLAPMYPWMWYLFTGLTVGEFSLMLLLFPPSCVCSRESGRETRWLVIIGMVMDEFVIHICCLLIPVCLFFFIYVSTLSAFAGGVWCSVNKHVFSHNSKLNPVPMVTEFHSRLFSCPLEVLLVVTLPWLTSLMVLFCV